MSKTLRKEATSTAIGTSLTTKQERKRQAYRRRIRAMGFRLGNHLEYIVTMRLATAEGGWNDAQLKVLAKMAQKGLFQ